MSYTAARPRRLRTGHLAVAAVAAVIVSAAVPAVAAFAGSAPQGVIVNAGGADAIANSYIVVLKDTQSVRASAVGTQAKSLAGKHSATVKRTYQSALRGFSATMTEAQAKAMSLDGSVAFIEQNHAVHAYGTQASPPSWGLDRIDQASLPLNSSYTYPNTATNVHAYIIDTGILTSHTTFGGRATHGYDAVDDDSNATDCNGHGTHVAGTVGGATYGVAKGVQLVAVRVLDCAGSGDDAGVIAGIDWVTANAIKPAVANMSLGGEASTALDNAVIKSINAGITYGVAAGNDATNACSSDSPSRVAAAITVGATERTDARASYSNYGSCLDIFAPGSSITSSWYTSNSATNSISGTSMATPHVVGAAALVLGASPSLTPAQVAAKLVADSSKDKVTSPGSGSANRLLFVGGSTTPPPPPPGGKSFENTTVVAIPDAGAAVTSSIVVSGVTGNAPSTLKVGVYITHPYIGDLVVDLIAPDGTVYNLHNRTDTSTDNIAKIYTVNASSEVANGTWRLRAQDKASADVGSITKFSLQF